MLSLVQQDVRGHLYGRRAGEIPRIDIVGLGSRPLTSPVSGWCTPSPTFSPLSTAPPPTRPPWVAVWQIRKAITGEHAAKAM
jgi:hypothetical protein